MRNILIMSLLCVATLGCASQPERVDVPVAVPCVSASDIPAGPEYADRGDLLKLDRFKRTLKVWEERIQAINHATALRAMLEACVR